MPVRSMGVERRAPYPYGSKFVTHLLHSLHWGNLDLRLNRDGLYELFVFPGLAVLAGSAVGGGSTAFGGLLELPRNPALWRGHHPLLNPGSIERYYAKVIADLGGVTLRREDALPQSVWTHLEDTPERRCRPATEQPRMALLIPPSPSDAGKPVPTSGGVQRQYCAFDGDSFLGSRGGAKASVDFVYLAPVLDQGVTVRDSCEATRIQATRPVDGNGYIVHYTNRATRQRAIVQAKKVVLAAGTLNTLRLLFESAREAGGLVPMPALGRNFSANGDVVGLWRRRHAAVSSFTSTPSQGAFDVSGYEGATYGFGGLPGLQTLPLPSFVKRRLGETFFLYGMGADGARATVDCDAGHLSSDYSERQEPIYKRVRAAFQVLSVETGDKIWTPTRPITVHASGGASVGARADSGVVDHRGEVFGNAGLFVADGAALPAAVGGPPCVAIAAWSHHVSDGVFQSG
jgi:cholesterol oxidase